MQADLSQTTQLKQDAEGQLQELRRALSRELRELDHLSPLGEIEAKLHELTEASADGNRAAAVARSTQEEFRESDAMKEAMSPMPVGQLKAAQTLQAQNSALRKAMAALAELESLRSALKQALFASDELEQVRKVAKFTQACFLLL